MHAVESHKPTLSAAMQNCTNNFVLLCSLERINRGVCPNVHSIICLFVKFHIRIQGHEESDEVATAAADLGKSSQGNLAGLHALCKQ